MEARGGCKYELESEYENPLCADVGVLKGTYSSPALRLIAMEETSVCKDPCNEMNGVCASEEP